MKSATPYGVALFGFYGNVQKNQLTMELKNYSHTFTDQVCATCRRCLHEDYWTEHELLQIERSGVFCPKCRTKYYLGTIERRGSWLDSVKYVMFSKKRKFVRTVHEDELIKLHGISAWWFHIGREIYLARESFPDYNSEAVKDFKKKFSTPENVLVYLPNNYLQRLYFFVPRDAISE